MIAGALFGEKYRLERVLGEGAMGRVWAARDLKTERRVAIKVLRLKDPRLQERLLSEARAAGRVVHRNVVELFDAGETKEGAPYLVMPLLEGETLASCLKRELALPKDTALYLGDGQGPRGGARGRRAAP